MLNLIVFCLAALQLVSADYLGCYNDQTIRDLPHVNNNMGGSLKASTCISYCENRGYKYAGLQAGRQCWCGNSYGRYEKKSDDTCNLPCPAQAVQSCGANNHNSVYETGYLGCFRDNPDRDLPHKSNSVSGSSTLQRSTCVSYCKTNGYKYAGLQNGNQCFCGNDFGEYGEYPDSDCNRTCPGNSLQNCGASWRNSIYKTGLVCGC